VLRQRISRLQKYKATHWNSFSPPPGGRYRPLQEPLIWGFCDECFQILNYADIRKGVILDFILLALSSNEGLIAPVAMLQDVSEVLLSSLLFIFAWKLVCLVNFGTVVLLAKQRKNFLVADTLPYVFSTCSSWFKLDPQEKNKGQSKLFTLYAWTVKWRLLKMSLLPLEFLFSTLSQTCLSISNHHICCAWKHANFTSVIISFVCVDFFRAFTNVGSSWHAFTKQLRSILLFR